MQENQIPVFVINGFLEGGKTQFMKFTMQQDYFQTDGMTLLLLCEEGEEEYDKKLLSETNTVLKIFDSVDALTPDVMKDLSDVYAPERILIEWNGVWPQDTLLFPDGWYLNQMVTVFDTSTLDLYIKNMKPLMGQMLKKSELVICNRADHIEEDVLSGYHLVLKAMAPSAEIVFEGMDGEIKGDFSINLPYDLEQSRLVIKPEEYGVFYVDAMDRASKYDGKEIEFIAQILKPKGIPENMLVPGRRAMTCCEADMQFLGFMCQYVGAVNFSNRDWVKIKGKIKKEFNSQYGGEGPVIYATEIIRTGPIKEIVSF